MEIRNDFPPMGSKFFGGESNGLVYKTAFFGTTLASSFEMVNAFLDEQGYADIPRPKDAEELRAFLHPPKNGIQGLFDQPCYAHNPIRISFVRGDRKRRKLVLELYNELAPDQLLRFHQRHCPEKEAELLSAMEKTLFEMYGDIRSL
jgi:hypothetical protein